MSITLHKIAQIAKVSKTTASFVLNGDGERRGISQETIRNVQKVAEQQGYIPNQTARFFRHGKQQLIAFLAPNVLDEFFIDIAMAIESMAEKDGYQILFGSTFQDFEREAKYIKSLIGRRIDGLILLPIDIHQAHLAALHQNQMPTIMFRRQGDIKTFKCMSFNDMEASYLATRHLIERGCRRIAFLADMPPDREWIQLIHEARFDGCQKAVHEAGPAFPDPRNYFCNPLDGQECLQFQKKIKEDAIDGIVGVGNFICIKLMNTIKEAGLRIPQDIKIIGCDDSTYSPYLAPPLSTVSYPKDELGRAMFNELMQIIEGNPINLDEELFHPQLVARASST